MDKKLLRDKIMEFLKKNPYPEDSKIHNLAAKLQMDPSALETEVYGILAEMVFPKEGKMSGGSKEAIKEGMTVESEHTDVDAIKRKILEDHLNEDLNYYEKLKKVEKK